MELPGSEPFWIVCEALCLLTHHTLILCDKIVERALLVQELKRKGATSRCYCQGEHNGGAKEKKVSILTLI